MTRKVDRQREGDAPASPGQLRGQHEEWDNHPVANNSTIDWP